MTMSADSYAAVAAMWFIAGASFAWLVHVIFGKDD